jgi:hypothetical protein
MQEQNFHGFVVGAAGRHAAPAGTHRSSQAQALRPCRSSFRHAFGTDFLAVRRFTQVICPLTVE